MFSRILAPGRDSGQKDAAGKAKIAQTSPKTGLTGLLDISYKTSPENFESNATHDSDSRRLRG
jgi:hypothetical protein